MNSNFETSSQPSILKLPSYGPQSMPLNSSEKLLQAVKGAHAGSLFPSNLPCENQFARKNGTDS